MIIFKELILENFGPYFGKNIIDLSPQYNQDKNTPIILFGGMNGGGKTTLMDSIRLALYGRRAECINRENLSYNDFLRQSINKKIKLGEKTRIELTLEHIIDNEWKEIKIVRHWEQNVKDGKDNLGIVEGDFPDIELTQNWDEYLENFLPLGISSLFLFDGEQVKELAEQELPSSSVKNAIKSLLGLELAEQLIIDLELLKSRKEKQFTKNDRTEELENFEDKLILLEKKKNDTIQELRIAENRLKTANKKHRQISKSLRELGIKIASEKETFKIKKEAIENEIANLNSSLIKLSSQYLPLALIDDSLTQLQKQLEIESELLQLKNAQTVCQKRDEKLLSFLGQVSLDEEKYQQVKDFLDSENKQLNQKVDSGETYLFASEDTLPNLKQIRDSLLPKQQQETRKKLHLLNSLTQELNTLEQQLEQVESPELYQQKEKEYQQEEKKLLKTKTVCENIKTKLETIKTDIVFTRKKLSSYSEGNIKNQQSQHLIEALPKVENTLALFQEKLTLRKLNKLESEVTTCFRYLLHKSNFISRIGIATDTFALSVYNQDGDFVPKQRLSAGEKQLLAISLLWGLARVSEKNLPIAIDTPLARLDSSHRSNLINRYFPTASHQVILLSTDTEITETQIKRLREKEVIAREYLLDYDSKENLTTIKSGYFW